MRYAPKFNIAEMCELYVSGFSLSELAQRYGVDTPTVWKKLREAGVTLRPRGIHFVKSPRAFKLQGELEREQWILERDQRIVEQYHAAGMTVGEFARAAGISVSCARSCLRRARIRFKREASREQHSESIRRRDGIFPHRRHRPAHPPKQAEAKPAWRRGWEYIGDEASLTEAL